MNEKEKAEIAKLEAEIADMPESLKDAWANGFDFETLNRAMKAEEMRVKPLRARIACLRKEAAKK
jgi:hypothetical protein